MSIVLRCPKCGTTGATPGECDACHEAALRYYCTNHEPGLWLDAPTCPTCAAQRADAARRPAVAAATAPTRPSRAPARAPTRWSPPVYTVPDPPRAEVREPPETDRWDVDERLAPEASAPEPLRGPLWQQLLRAALVARSIRLPAAPESDGRSLRRMGGCLVRLVLVGVALIVAFISAIYFFGSSLLPL